MVFDCSKVLGAEEMAKVLDNIKLLGFRFATKSGTTIGMSDIEVPAAKTEADYRTPSHRLPPLKTSISVV